jgi:hypothetical protein
MSYSPGEWAAIWLGGIYNFFTARPKETLFAFNATFFETQETYKEN